MTLLSFKERRRLDIVCVNEQGKQAGEIERKKAVRNTAVVNRFRMEKSMMIHCNRKWKNVSPPLVEKKSEFELQKFINIQNDRKCQK